MLRADELERLYQALPPAPTDRGTVRLVVARLGGGEHRTLERAELTCQAGLTGDRWSVGPRPSVDRQITIMDARVAALVCDERQPLHLPGDNLLVDFDISEANTPVGTRLRIGGATLEVTDKPHTGCKKFAARFGSDALAWINAEPNRALRLRGLNARVVEDGAVALGDPVVRRPRDA